MMHKQLYNNKQILLLLYGIKKTNIKLDKFIKITICNMVIEYNRDLYLFNYTPLFNGSINLQFKIDALKLWKKKCNTDIVYQLSQNDITYFDENCPHINGKVIDIINYCTKYSDTNYIRTFIDHYIIKFVIDCVNIKEKGKCGKIRVSFGFGSSLHPMPYFNEGPYGSRITLGNNSHDCKDHEKTYKLLKQHKRPTLFRKITDCYCTLCVPIELLTIDLFENILNKYIKHFDEIISIWKYLEYFYWPQEHTKLYLIYCCNNNILIKNTTDKPTFNCPKFY